MKYLGLDRQSAGAQPQSLPPGVVLRAANPESNDCRGQSHHNSQLSPPQAVTEEECGRKCSDYLCIAGVFQTFRFRRSSSDLASLGHLPPGGRVLVLIWTLSVQFDAILGVSPQFLTNTNINKTQAVHWGHHLVSLYKRRMYYENSIINRWQ